MKKSLLLMFLLINILLLFSEEIIDEIKEPLFSFDILEEDDFYLYLEGEWKFDLSTAAKGNIDKIIDNIIFKQTPDFQASLWLFNKYFFEAEIKEKSSDNLFLLGYQNSEGLLQEVRVGNSDININQYAGYTPPINVQKAPGFRFKLGTKNTEHELLTRLTSEVKNSISYRGLNQIDEETLTINEYSRGIFYILPESFINGLIVYYMDDSELKILNNQDYIYNTDRSLLQIFNPDISEIYIGINNLTESELYDFVDQVNNPGVGTPVDSSTLWSNYTTVIDSKQLLKVKTLGTYSPFEFLGAYEVSVTNLLNNNNTEVSVNGQKNLNFDIIDSYIIFWDTIKSNDNIKQRYPFKELDQDIYVNGGRGLTSSSIIDITILTPVESITVPSEAKENSLSVFVNGIKEYSFIHHTDTGILELNKEISPFDEITINYDTELIPGTGNLLISYGSRYNFKKNLILDLSQTGSWDFSTNDYSYEYNENRGEFKSRSKLIYETALLSAELTNTLGISNPDTLGKYLLFEYNEGKISLPLNQTTISEDKIGNKQFIKREIDDSSLTIDEIVSKPENPIGGAYFATHLYNRSNNRVLVLESDDLTATNSKAVLSLGEYKNDYSFARKFTLDIFNNSGDIRTLKVIFTNPGISGSAVERDITLDASVGYKTYIIDFTKEEREKLSYIDELGFYIENCGETLLLLKNMTFIGDSLVTHNSSNDTNINKIDKSLNITQSGEVINQIEVSSRIKEIDLDRYNYLSFNILESSLLKNDGNVEIILKSHLSPTARLTIPSNLLSSGNNNFEINLTTKKVKLNGVYQNTILWDKLLDIKSNSISIIFNSDGDGDFTISEIELREPKLDMFNRTNMDIVLSPDISIIANTFPIVDSLVLKNSNSLDVDNNTSYKGQSGISLIFLGSLIDSKISYSDGLDSLKYSILIPYKSAPVSLYDSFEYNINSKRENRVKISGHIASTELTLSNFKTSNKSLRDNKLKIDLLKKYPFNITIQTSISQKKEDQLDNINNEFYDSYYDIILKNNLDELNMFNSKLDLLLDKKVFDITINTEANFTQENLNINRILCEYDLIISPSVDIGFLNISPGFTTNYTYSEKENFTDNLTDGFYGLKEIFNNTNPYRELTLSDLLFNNETDSFYNEYNNATVRDLNSDITLALSLNIKNYSIFNIIIPNGIKISQGKSFTAEESREESRQNFIIEGNFLLHPVIKNSILFSRSYNLERDVETKSVEWTFKLYKELKTNMSLEVKNNLTILDTNISNLTTTDFIWPGKKGPVFIIPLLDRVLNSPYHNIYKERLYLKVDNTSFDLGIRHDTILKVKDINETNLYIDFGYDTSTTSPLYFEAGITTTLIF